MLLALVAVLLFAAASLAFGAGYLLWMLPGGVPLGNLLAVAGMLAGAGIPLRVMPAGPRFRIAASVVLAMAVLWYPLGILIAGNPRLEFSGASEPARWYWYFTGATSVAILAMVAATIYLSLRSAIELAESDG